MKLLVSDYDQTFYLNDQDIEKNKQAIQKFRKEKNYFAIATGRSYYDFIKKQKQYQFDCDFVLLNHGATILTFDYKILQNIPIDNAILSSLKPYLKLEESVASFFCSGLESRVRFDHGDLTKINVYYPSKEQAQKVIQKINRKFKDYVHAYYVTINSIEIVSNKVNKAQAIEQVIKEYNIKKEDVFTVGDGDSDQEMIQKFHGYHMKDCVEQLKKHSEGQVESVSELVEKILENN